MKRREPSAPVGTIVVERMPLYSSTPEERAAGEDWEVLRVETGWKTVLASALSREAAELRAETERDFS